jgi:pSer/pThr/pTyr-binding forkhead associated (FHA) protein/S1-C subfamily serine protease
MKLTIVHLEGSKQGLTETLTGEVITMGRDPSNSLSFDPFKDLDVSARHATVSVQGDQAMLQDLGSTNGTFLNDVKVQGAVPLPNGCMVRFGDNGPKLQVTWTLDEGPGKKTRMIQDLSAALDEEGLKRKQAGKRNLVIIVLLILLGAGVTAGVLIVKSNQAQAKLLEDVAKAKRRAEQEKASAETVGAPAQAKADWEAAEATFAAAAKAEEAGELQKAVDTYQEAFDGYQKASKTAGNAALAELRKQLDQASKQAEKSLAAKEEKDKADRERLQQQNADMLAKLKQELEAARQAQDLLKGLDGIDESDPSQLDQGIASLEKALAGMPADSPERKELEERLAAMKAKKEELGNVSERLQEAAKQAKAKIVAIHCKVVALPKGQRKETTKIRVTVAESNGTGFFASANGRVVTAKEVAYPEKFDPKAAALKAKLDERGMSYYRELTVSTYDDTTKVYSATHASDSVAVAREFDDAFGAKQTVKIPFDNTEVEVTVRPHERGDADVVVLQVDGIEGAAFLEVHDGENAAGLPLVALGTQKDDAGKYALFMFEGQVKEGGRVMTLEVPSFSSWIGGPLLNADGKVIGIVVSPDLKESKGVAGSVFAPTVE